MFLKSNFELLVGALEMQILCIFIYIVLGFQAIKGVQEQNAHSNKQQSPFSANSNK